MSSGGGGKLASEINVTPLVDVMLVLLIIFMITAPMMNTGVDIDLPEAGGEVLEDPEGKLVLSITGSKQLFLGTTPVKWSDLQVKLETNERVKKEKELWIEADSTLPYGVVVAAMAMARQAGVVKLQMLTDPSEVMSAEELDKQAAPGASRPPKK
jgi:biopolymer transport protein TolR